MRLLRPGSRVSEELYITRSTSRFMLVIVGFFAARVSLYTALIPSTT